VIALMGAAGNVGSKVAGLLLDAGEEIRVLKHTRDLATLRQRGAHVVAGGATSANALRELFEGATAALVLLPEDVTDRAFVAKRALMSRAIRDALRNASVRHIVALSAIGADQSDVPGPQAGLFQFEQDLAELEANVLVLRSATYMDQLLSALPMIEARKVNGSAIKADVRFPMVATKDVAAEAAARLRRRDFTGHGVALLLGPEDITMTEATKTIGARIGVPDLPYIAFAPDDVRASLVAAGMSNEVAVLLVEMQRGINEGRFIRGVRRTPESTTSTGLEEFLASSLSR